MKKFRVLKRGDFFRIKRGNVIMGGLFKKKADAARAVSLMNASLEAAARHKRDS